METYYLHDYDIDGSGVRLVYLRKADGNRGTGTCFTEKLSQ